MVDWHKRYYEVAELVASWSKDWSTQVGCVVFNPQTKSILTVGYNGFPRGMRDTGDDRRERSVKNKLTVHAEMNAILNAARNGLSLEGASLIATFFPCATCAGAIVQCGIKNVITKQPDWSHERWGEDFLRSHEIFEETGINMVFLED